MVERPSWDAYFMGLAEKAAEMGTCGRKKVGAVIVDPVTKAVVSTGFNGAPRGLEHCTDMNKNICDGGCLNDEKRCVKSIHAEHNAILFANQDLKGCVIYCTDEPCENCTKYIVQTGISKVVYKNAYFNKYNEYFRGNIIWSQFIEEEPS